MLDYLLSCESWPYKQHSVFKTRYTVEPELNTDSMRCPCKL